MGAVDPATMQPLVQARSAALENVALYPQVLPPIIGLVTEGTTSLELRRWVADFLSEALASPLLPSQERQKMALKILPILKTFMDSDRHDSEVMKSSIQAAASLYPLIFRHIIDNPADGQVWQSMLSIKSMILQEMDSYPSGVRICCIKFIQRVVQTQSPGVIADPRRPESNEISLALVPRDHPLIPPSNVEAETSGLLDRMLGLLQEETSDALVVTATLNSLGALIKTRATIANRILNAVLMFNPLNFGKPPLTTKARIVIRSLERTVRALVVNVLKRAPNHPLAGRMQAYLERLSQSRQALFDEAGRKRPAPLEADMIAVTAKRPRLEPDTSMSAFSDAAVSVSVAQLFTLTQDPGAANFSVQAIPHETVSKLLVPLLKTVSKQKLDEAVITVKKRLGAVKEAQSKATNPSLDEEEDYEPDYQPEDAEQVRNRMEMEDDDLGIGIPKPTQVALPPFQLPRPHFMSPEDAEMLFNESMDLMLERISPSTDSTNKVPKGFLRLAASDMDQRAMIVHYVRLITRPFVGLRVLEEDMNGTSAKSKSAKVPSDAILVSPRIRVIADKARQRLLNYIMSDWTRRLDIAVTWLTEEWYNDAVAAKAFDEGQGQSYGQPPRQNFSVWAYRLLDEISTPISTEHQKLLIRLVSEIPGLDREMIGKIKHLALDPERVPLVANTLLYLALYRLPVKELCIDALEDLWRHNEDAKGKAAQMLSKLRPEILETVKSEPTEEGTA